MDKTLLSMEVGHLNNKIGFIIQARMQSTRLPGKILKNLPIGADSSILSTLIDTLKKSKFNTQIIIATSNNSENDVLENFSLKHEVSCFRGSENDVLSRFISINEMNQFDVIVRLTADNPLIDIKTLDQSIEKHVAAKNDYTYTKELPIGMNLEIVSGTAISSLKELKLTDSDREHVTQFIRINHQSYKTEELKFNFDQKFDDIRVTIDYPSDYLVVSSLLNLAEKAKVPLGLELILFAQENYSWVFDVNSKNYQKQSYNSFEDELSRAIPILKNHEFDRIVEKLQKMKA